MIFVKETQKFSDFLKQICGKLYVFLSFQENNFSAIRVQHKFADIVVLRVYVFKSPHPKLARARKVLL